MLFVRLARASAEVAATSSRSAKIAALDAVLRGTGPDEVPAAVAYLSGELRQRRTGLGYAALRDLPAPAAQPSLTVAEVDAAFAASAALAGAGSQTARRRLLTNLLSRATTEEQALLRGLVAGDVRQGALEGIMVEAVARAAAVPVAAVRRALMLRGALPPVAEAALRDGEAGLAVFRLEVGRPLLPMLAQPADGVAPALERLGEAAVEWKLDGVRLQVHRLGDDVRVFTRTLDDVTDRLPEVVEATLALPCDRVVLDGETLALDSAERPRPFQVTAGRVSSRLDVRRARAETPLRTFFFDVLHLDGEDVLALDGATRWEALQQAVPAELLVPRMVTEDAAAAGAFLDDALARGHEGVLLKALDVPYEAGRRGVGWVKVKPRHAVDLVVLAAEWGHGRRRGWLSNLHLGARDPAGLYGEPGGFVMLGKTFKGLTDAMLRWQTERFLQLETHREGHVVYLRPEQVVEIAFDGVQTSPRYPAGMALRFARVIRYRDDKVTEEADTIGTLRSYLNG